MPSNHPRCAQHGLVVATDNMCVLCRKKAGSTSRPPKKARYIVPLTAAELTAGGSVGVLRVVSLLGSLLLMVSGAAYVLKMSPAQVPDSRAAAASVERANPRPSEELTELDRANAADLAAASLALLEQAGAERRDEQQLAAAEAEQQRVAAQAAARAQEEAARDRAPLDVVPKSQ